MENHCDITNQFFLQCERIKSTVTTVNTKFSTIIFFYLNYVETSTFVEIYSWHQATKINKITFRFLCDVLLRDAGLLMPLLPAVNLLKNRNK